MILVTGANGFIGRRLCQSLLNSGHPVRQAVRTAERCVSAAADTAEVVEVGDIGPETAWQQALNSVELVVHLAARAHCLDRTGGVARDYLEVNALGTERLAQQAAAAGVRRFVLLSTIKVNGERTGMLDNGGVERFTENDPPRPEGPYAESKREAEKRLLAVGAATGMEVVIIRPPLVYGPGAKANLRRLLNMIHRGFFLPFGSVRNGRNLVYLDNLVDFIVCCLYHPAAAGETFLVSDDQELSTPELIRQLAAAMGREARLWPCPVPLLRLAGWLLGRSAETERLTGSLRVDSGKARSVLGWRPPSAVVLGIRETADWYLRHQE